jgi:hypothetical protein
MPSPSGWSTPVSSTAGACVYTCLFGRYETLNEQPAAKASRLPFICLTDDPALTSETWRIIQAEAVLPNDSVRSQRLHKIDPPAALQAFQASVYIDNSVILKQPPERMLERHLGSHEFAVPTHGYRESIADEFAEVASLSLDDPDRLSEQQRHYEICDPGSLAERPYWAGILLRRHMGDRVQKVARIWAAHVLRYSRRDQLSLNYALRTAGLVPERIDIDNFTSEFHEWPVTDHRRTEVRTFAAAPGSSLERVRALETELAELQTRMNELQSCVDMRHHALADELAAARQRVHEVESSNSWRLTSPLRGARRALTRWLPRLVRPSPQ